MSIPEIQSRRELLDQFKLRGSVEEMPTFTTTTQEIFKLMAASSFNQTTLVKSRVRALEQMIVEKTDPFWDKAEVFLRGIITTALVAGIVIASLLGAAPVIVTTSISYTVLNLYNMYRAAGYLDIGLVLLALISGPIPCIIEGIQKFLAQDPRVVYGYEKKETLQQLAKFGKEFEAEAAKLNKRMDEQMALLAKALPTDTTQKAIEEYKEAKAEFELGRKYYTQFKEE